MAICPSFIGARVLRVTRLDSCGRPVYGPDSQAVSDGFVSVEISPDVEEGEDYTQRNANGDLCVSEKGQDSLQWLTVSIEFCRVDPCLWSLMNPTWKLVRGAHGEVTGFRIGTRFSDREGFALELWPKVSAQGALCDDDAPEEADPNGYFLLPYVIGTAPDSWTLEDGVATFTLTGRTKGGSLWGRGPYNVTHDADGTPVPLLEPIDSGSASNNPDHFHADIVTLAPPEPTCGCQPLEPVAPSAEGGQITIDADQPNRACFTVQGSAARQVTIDWGDGTPPVTSRVGREECHLYTETGTYTVTVADIDDPEKSSTYTAEITEVPALPAPAISVAPESGEAPLAVTLTVNNHGNGQVTIDWGDGTAPSTHNGGTEEEPATHPHQYLSGAADPYTITVTAVADDRAQATTDVTVTAPEPEDPPQISADPQTGPAPLATTLTVNNLGGGDVQIDFGDGSDPETGPGGQTGQTVDYPHTYTEAGTYTVTVTDADTPSRQATLDITVEEAPEPPTDPQATVTPDTGEAPLEVEVTVDNHGNGPVDVDFGDGSAPVTNPGDGTTTTSHTYTDAGTYTVTATSQADPSASGTADVEVTDPEAPVAAPTGLAITDTTAESITVEWEWEQGDGPAATGFGLIHRTPPQTGEWEDTETVDATVRTHVFDGLSPDTEYEFGVITLADGEQESDEATVSGMTDTT